MSACSHRSLGCLQRGAPLTTALHATSRAVRRSRRTAVAVAASSEYEALRGKTVYRATSGDAVDLLSLWDASPNSKAVVSFMTHFADLSSWELGQKWTKVIPTLEQSGVKFIAIGLGSTANAQEFARALKFPTDRLYADPDGAAYRALGFSGGFGEGLDISPYAKLVPMLMGIGSPGTLQEVIRGYMGDKNAKPVFDTATPFDVLGTGFQRPMELASLRLLNMMGILPRWNDLSPPNTQLLTQQGGTLVFNGTSVLFKHMDSGILKYTDVDEVMQSALSADYTPSIPTDLAQRASP